MCLVQRYLDRLSSLVESYHWPHNGNQGPLWLCWKTQPFWKCLFNRIQVPILCVSSITRRNGFTKCQFFKQPPSNSMHVCSIPGIFERFYFCAAKGRVDAHLLINNHSCQIRIRKLTWCTNHHGYIDDSNSSTCLCSSRASRRRSRWSAYSTFVLFEGIEGYSCAFVLISTSTTPATNAGVAKIVEAVGSGPSFLVEVNIFKRLSEVIVGRRWGCCHLVAAGGHYKPSEAYTGSDTNTGSQGDSNGWHLELGICVYRCGSAWHFKSLLRLSRHGNCFLTEV